MQPRHIFCLRRSPDHGTVDVVVVLLLLLLLLGGATLIFDFFQDTEIFIKTFVDNNKVTNPTNFQPVVTSTSAKKAKNDFAIFCNFAVF